LSLEGKLRDEIGYFAIRILGLAKGTVSMRSPRVDLFRETGRVPNMLSVFAWRMDAQYSVHLSALSGCSGLKERDGAIAGRRTLLGLGGCVCVQTRRCAARPSY
jgi:hypothetical protein